VADDTPGRLSSGEWRLLPLGGAKGPGPGRHDYQTSELGPFDPANAPPPGT
jgi:hypothetical protein